MDHDVYEFYLIAIGFFSPEDICQSYIFDLLFKVFLEGIFLLIRVYTAYICINTLTLTSSFIELIFSPPYSTNLWLSIQIYGYIKIFVDRYTFLVSFSSNKNTTKGQNLVLESLSSIILASILLLEDKLEKLGQFVLVWEEYSWC